VTVAFNFIIERTVDNRSVPFLDVKSVGHTKTNIISKLLQSYMIAVDKNCTIT
jgi:hypothetical protein